MVSFFNKYKNTSLVRRRGSGLLIMALVGAAVVGVTSLSLAKANSIAINALGSNKIAMQAQQYALAKSELIRSANYSGLTAQSKQDIQNSNGFQDEVVVGAETDVDATTKKKDVTVRVYKKGETLPRSSVIVTRYNKSMDSSLPSGSIIPWYGNLGSIPNGFRLCDGSNGTPDLRDRFIVGAGNSYGLSAVGGASHVQLSWNEMPSHAHTRGTMNITGTTATSNDLNSYPHVFTGAFYWYYNDGSARNANDHDGRSVARIGFDASRTWTGETSYAGSNWAHENRPPYYALYYIMKV